MIRRYAGDHRKQGIHCLEFDKRTHLDAQTVGDTAQQIKPNTDAAVLDFPNMRLIRAGHQSKLALGEALPLPLASNCGTEHSFAFACIHACMVWGKIKLMICYSKSKDEWADDAHVAALPICLSEEGCDMGDNPIGMLGKAADGAAKTIAAGAELIAKNAGERIGRTTSETPSNSNEEIDPEDFFQNVLVAALGVPGVKINREEYLRSALQNYCEDALIDAAVEQGPIDAGVSRATIGKLANEAIQYETTKVTLVSAATGIPGGIAMAATIPADAAQNIAHMLRITQKLAYLYGWPDFFNRDGTVDEGTKNVLTLFLGAMFASGLAVNGIHKVAEMMARQAVKKLPQKALTKGVIYPIVKKVASLIGAKMTKDIFAKGVAKAIPGIGAIFSGGITLATFLPMCNRLKGYLDDLAEGKEVPDALDVAEVNCE